MELILILGYNSNYKLHRLIMNYLNYQNGGANQL